MPVPSTQLVPSCEYRVPRTNEAAFGPLFLSRIKRVIVERPGGVRCAEAVGMGMRRRIRRAKWKEEGIRRVT